MCKDILKRAQLIHDFFSKGIFERRKTQYILFLFYLGTIGTCVKKLHEVTERICKKKIESFV